MEAAQMDRWLGLPVGALPVMSAGLAAYLEEMDQQGSLAVAETTRQVMSALLAPPGGQSFVPPVFLGRLTTSGLLALQIRAADGFRWHQKREHLLCGGAVTVPTMRRITPRPFREWSAARRARRREGDMVSG